MDASTAHSAVLEEFTLRGFDTSAIASASAPTVLATPDNSEIEASRLIVDILQGLLKSEILVDSNDEQAHNMQRISELLIPAPNSCETRRMKISRLAGEYGAVEMLLNICTSNPQNSISSWAFSCLKCKSAILDHSSLLTQLIALMVTPQNRCLVFESAEFARLLTQTSKPTPGLCTFLASATKHHCGIKDTLMKARDCPISMNEKTYQPRSKTSSSCSLRAFSPPMAHSYNQLVKFLYPF